MQHNYEWFEYKKEPRFQVIKSDSLFFHPHMHMQYEFAYVLSGKTKITIGGEQRVLQEDEFCFILNNQIHSYEAIQENEVYIMIIEPFLVSEFANILSNKKFTESFFKAYDNKEHYRHCLDKIYEAFNNADNELILHGYVFILLGELVKSAAFLENKTLERGSVSDILEVVENNYDKKISLDFISKKAGVSKMYISRLFNKEIGRSLNDYVKVLRVNKARGLLATDMTITEISYDCGFDHVRTFYRAFQDICGTTPKKYRELRYKQCGSAVI